MTNSGFWKAFGLLSLCLTASLLVGGCKKKSDQADTKEGAAMATEPQRVKVQHILIAFSGTLPGQTIDRTQAQAEKLATDLLDKAKDPKANFEAMVKEHSNDRPPGVYEMTNKNVPPSGGAFPREQMVPGFGDVAFQLQVGEVGIAAYDKQSSPFGYHIIRRLE